MPTLTLEYRDENERLALEQAIAYVSQLRQVAQDAPEGSVLNVCETIALQEGRQLLRSTLRAALEARITAEEQKGAMPDSARKRTPDATKASTPEPS